MNQAYFHECLNFAGVESSASVYVCENNQYGEFTPYASVTAGGRIARARRRLRHPGSRGRRQRCRLRSAPRPQWRSSAPARAAAPPCSSATPTGTRGTRATTTRGRYRPDEEFERWLARDPLSCAERSSIRARRARESADRGGARRGTCGGEGRPAPDPARPVGDEGAGWLSSATGSPSGTRSRRRWSAIRACRAAREDVAYRRRLQRHSRTSSTASARSRDRHADLGARLHAARPSARRSRGLRPVVEIMFADFLGLVARLARRTRRPSTGTSRTSRRACRYTIRTTVGAGGRFGAIHSQTPTGLAARPSGPEARRALDPADAKGLLKAAIRDDNPVVVFEHKLLYGAKGEVGGRRRGRAAWLAPRSDAAGAT